MGINYIFLLPLLVPLILSLFLLIKKFDLRSQRMIFNFILFCSLLSSVFLSSLLGRKSVFHFLSFEMSTLRLHYSLLLSFCFFIYSHFKFYSGDRPLKGVVLSYLSSILFIFSDSILVSVFFLESALLLLSFNEAKRRDRLSSFSYLFAFLTCYYFLNIELTSIHSEALWISFSEAEEFLPLLKQSYLFVPFSLAFFGVYLLRLLKSSSYLPLLLLFFMSSQILEISFLHTSDFMDACIEFSLVFIMSYQVLRVFSCKRVAEAVGLIFAFKLMWLITVAFSFEEYSGYRDLKQLSFLVFVILALSAFLHKLSEKKGKSLNFMDLNLIKGRAQGGFAFLLYLSLLGLPFTLAFIYTIQNSLHYLSAGLYWLMLWTLFLNMALAYVILFKTQNLMLGESQIREQRLLWKKPMRLSTLEGFLFGGVALVVFLFPLL